MGNRKPLCNILWITQVLFVLVAVGFMALWVMNELSVFGTEGIWFLTPDRSGALEPIISFITFVFVGGNYFVLQTFCGGSDKSEPSLGGPKKLTNHTYRQYIRYRFRDFNVKGLSTHGPYTLELARVYVELSVAPKPFHAATSNIVQLPEKLQSGRHDIWAYLQQTEQNFAIIGPPGSGKTTLLSHIALTVTQSWFQRRKEGVPNKLPILLTLLEHAEAIATKGDEPFAMEDAVRADLSKWKKEVPEGWVRRFLDKGNYLVLLDGLDEVADKVQRQKVVAWVERQMKAYPMCQFIVTSRPHGYQSNPIAGVTTLEIRPYDNRQQAQFIRKWYLANEVMSRGGKEDAGVQMAAKEGADDLLRRLGDAPNLAELAVNPLLLTMIATVHRFRSVLPKRRVELYDEIFSVFLGTWRGARGIEQELTPDQRKQVLQPLAWEMMEQQLRQIPAKEAEKIIKQPLRRVDRKMAPAYFLEIVRYQSGLLVERENGLLAFAHLTFQEYLAGMHLHNEPGLLQPILNQVRESWWHEALLLYAAKQEGTAIIEACIDEKNRFFPESLMLAIDCNDEANQIEPETRERLETVLDDAIEKEGVSLRRIVAQAKLQRRLKRLTRLSEDIYIDSILITHVEYQLFLDNMRERDGEYYQPDHWLEYQYPSGMGHLPVVGVRASDAEAFCDWMTARSGGNFVFRLPDRKEAAIMADRFREYGHWIQKEDEFSVEVCGVAPRISIDKVVEYLDLDLDRARARDLDLDLTRALTRARARARGLDPASVLDRALHLILVLARVLHLDLVLARALVHAGTLDLARNPDLYLNHALDLDFGHALDRDFALARTLDFARTLDLDHALDLDHTLDITHALDLDFGLALDRDLALVRTPARDLARSELRGVLYLIGFLFLKVQQARLREASLLKRQSAKWRQDQALLESFVVEYFGAFVDLCVLEERIKGNLLAFEGIRIVRERIKEA